MTWMILVTLLALLCSAIHASLQTQHALQPLPVVRVTLTPILQKRDRSRINITLDLPVTAAILEGPLLRLPLAVGNTPTQVYNATNPLKAWDKRGLLDLVAVDDATTQTRNWYAARVTSGEVSVSLTAWPRQVNLQTPTGPRIDLREHGGGLLGAVLSVVPLPVDRTQQFVLYFCWDLSHASPASTVASSFGEGRCESTISTLR